MFNAVAIPEGDVTRIEIDGVPVWKKSEIPDVYTEREYIEATDAGDPTAGAEA